MLSGQIGLLSRTHQYIHKNEHKKLEELLNAFRQTIAKPTPETILLTLVPEQKSKFSFSFLKSLGSQPKPCLPRSLQPAVHAPHRVHPAQCLPR